MENNSLVSVITPMHNSGRYILDTIESVKNQTYKNCEMIIIDDCSTDNSVELVKKYIQSDERIKLIRLEENVGVAKARNKGIENSKGRYLAFLDSDDLWLPDKLNKQIKFMQSKKVSFCYTACSVIDENSVATGKVRHVPPIVDYHKILRGNDIACLTVVIDKYIIPDVKMPDIKHEDYVTWVNILKNDIVAFGIDEVLARYRVARKSESGNKLKAATWQWKIYRKTLNLPIFSSVFYFCCYVFNAIAKRI